MVTTLPLGAFYGSTARPRSGVSWAIAFSVLLHVAAGWYLVSRFVIEPVFKEPDPPIQVAFDFPVTPPRADPPKAIEDTPVKPLEKPRFEPRPAERVADASDDVTDSPLPSQPVQQGEPEVTTQPESVPAMAPQPTKRVTPKYPDRAMDAGRDGDVEVLVTVGAAGAVLDASVIAENPKGYGFGRAAISAVTRWEFATAAPGAYRVTVKFRLGD